MSQAEHDIAGMSDAERPIHPAIWVRREGVHVVVLVEHNKQWVEIIRDLADAPFSHIKEAVFAPPIGGGGEDRRL